MVSLEKPKHFMIFSACSTLHHFIVLEAFIRSPISLSGADQGYPHMSMYVDMIEWDEGELCSREYTLVRCIPWNEMTLVGHFHLLKESPSIYKVHRAAFTP
jgi:hypothetical protein